LTPLTPPLLAVTVCGPPAVVPAVNRPVLATVPPPLTLQVKVGWGARLVANWSRAVALNCWVVDATTVALAGANTTLVSVGLTVTLTELVAVRLP
jgi:hypothetical protein